MRASRLLVVGIALVLVGLMGLILVSTRPWYGSGGRRSPGPAMRPPSGFQMSFEFESNGERIYFTATSASGEPIAFTGGPMWLRMHGGSCENCHGPGGRGGIRVMMTDQVSPDIRYSTLTSPEHGDEGEEHPPYTDALIKRAVAEGLDPAGEPLRWSMPRWRMSDGDLDDLVEYLKTLNGR